MYPSIDPLSLQTRIIGFTASVFHLISASNLENQESRIENQESRIENQESRIEIRFSLTSLDQNQTTTCYEETIRFLCFYIFDIVRCGTAIESDYRYRKCNA